MRAKDFVPASKPRNFVAKNAKTAGAGAHKDKKKAAKQGDVKHKKQDVDEGWKSKVAGAALAGAAALGGGSAHAQISGEDTLPDIVAHVRFKVDGKEITKDINLGTTYKSPREAAAALEKFLRSKGIKYFEYDLERVKPKDKDYLDKAPYTDSGKTHGQMDAGPAVDTKSKNDYMSKD
jgi:hypothetical protein